MIINDNALIASEAYEKLTCALNKTTLTNAIKKASAVEQTSCLEGYHSVVNQFAPKMLAYSYLGMLCRYIHDNKLHLMECKIKFYSHDVRVFFSNL